MKFNKLFDSKRNIYFTIAIFVVLLLAGGLWQYKNIVEEQKLQAKLNEEMKQFYKEADSATGIQIIEDKSDSSNSDQVKEVANTGGSKLANAKAIKSPSKASTKAGAINQAISAIKMQDPKLETMVIPVFGTVSKDFSDTVLIYSQTLEQWATHQGLDIRTEEGSPVRAAMDGNISELGNDPQLGLTIIIDHGNGIFTKYCNLSTLDLVTKGQNVKKGDVISGVGKTALYEVVEDPHLHFEVIKNNKNIDPRAYLPKQSTKR